jgi:hypothetical protein
MSALDSATLSLIAPGADDDSIVGSGWPNESKARAGRIGPECPDPARETAETAICSPRDFAGSAIQPVESGDID